MGEKKISQQTDPERRRIFMQRVLEDVRALDQMLEQGTFESGVHRIGAEQELFLVDGGCRPAPVAAKMLEEIDDPRFTTELASFNLEFNLDPIDLGPSCLSQLEADLTATLDKARAGAEAVGAQVLLTGILPTLDKPDLSLENMAPVDRYFALNEAVHRLRGSDEFQLHIKGRDELTVTHDNVMLEACNTSFQVHFQVDADRFARLYNIAQTVTAPVLAAATCSPLLFGKRLWQETRIALFRQAVDTRFARSHRREQQPRVSFGEKWIDHSVLEIFREDIARFRLLLSIDDPPDSLADLARGKVPRLKALCLHNGTVYRWNRPCYGICNGKPHLRIENRVLPSGPSVIDEVANSAFWLGLIKGLSEEYGDITRHLRFSSVKENFLAAARLGLKAQFQWLGERSLPASELILSELLPRARGGLEALGVSAEDQSRYLDVIEERVESRQTGSQWMLDSLVAMKHQGTPTERLVHLTAATLARQKKGQPVHTWKFALPRESSGWENHYTRVSSLMTTDLFTVNEDEVIDLVACVMDWKHVRHVPVENATHRLVGLITHRTLLRILARHHGKPRPPIPVYEVMEKEVVTVHPETSTLEALELMREHKIACLPVVEDDRLVGILTERDFMKIASQLLESFLAGPDASSA